MTVGVVKIGGAGGNDPIPLLKELAARTEQGERWALIHGGSHEMEQACISLGIEPVYVTSPKGFRSRFTGEREMVVFKGVCGAISAEIVSSLSKMGCCGSPVWPGLYGARALCKDVLRSVEDGRVRLLRGNRSGSVASFQGEAVKRLWDKGILPVIPPIALEESSGKLLNVDGDRLAALVASSLGSEVLVILSNVPGVLSDQHDPGSLVSSGSVQDLMALAKGNMKRKIVAAEEALSGGVKDVILGDSRPDEPLSAALNGKGTKVCLSSTTVGV